MSSVINYFKSWFQDEADNIDFDKLHCIKGRCEVCDIILFNYSANRYRRVCVSCYHLNRYLKVYYDGVIDTKKEKYPHPKNIGRF